MHAIRRIFLSLVIFTLGHIWIQPAHAVELIFYKIASGPRGGIYFPLAAAIARAISNPPNAESCEQGANCGVPGLVATHKITDGSVANVDALLLDKYDAAIAQSDVTYWSFTGTGPFRARKPNDKICIITSLYKEEMHLVRARDARIDGVADLAGKRVALGEVGSGSLLGAQLLVRAYGMTEGKDFMPSLIDFKGAQKLMKSGQIDTLVFVSGYPNPVIEDMSQLLGSVLVPIAGPGRDRLTTASPFYTEATIPASTYVNQDTPIETLAVPTLWISRTNISDDLTYKITKAFWQNDKTPAILANGPPKATEIALSSAFEGASIPLCPGAQTFYKEIGMLP